MIQEDEDIDAMFLFSLRAKDFLYRSFIGTRRAGGIDLNLEVGHIWSLERRKRILLLRLRPILNNKIKFSFSRMDEKSQTILTYLHTP